MNYSYTKVKKLIAESFALGDFNGSDLYRQGRSPFDPGHRNQSIPTWDLWWQTLDNHAKRLSFGAESRVLLPTAQIEVIPLLTEDVGLQASQITHVADTDFKQMIAISLGTNSVRHIQETNDMKFTHIIKNPPWDQGQYRQFWEPAHERLEDGGWMLDILPTNWMCLPDFASDRAWLLEHFQIHSLRIYKNSKQEVFDVNPGGSEVVVMVAQKCAKPNNSLVEFTYMDQPPFTVDLTRYSIWPLYPSAIAVKVLDLVVSKKMADLDVVNYKRADHDFSQRVKSSHWISLPTKVHARCNADIMRAAGTEWRLNQLHEIEDTGIIQFDSANQAQLHYAWFSTPIWSYILSMVKSQGKNQPGQFIGTGLHAFVDTDFDRYFGFTQQHHDEVARWKSSL